MDAVKRDIYFLVFGIQEHVCLKQIKAHLSLMIVTVHRNLSYHQCYTD